MNAEIICRHYRHEIRWARSRRHALYRRQRSFVLPGIQVKPCQCKIALLVSWRNLNDFRIFLDGSIILALKPVSFTQTANCVQVFGINSISIMKYSFGLLEATLSKTNRAQEVKRPSGFSLRSEYAPELLFRLVKAILTHQLSYMSSNPLRIGELCKKHAED